MNKAIEILKSLLLPKLEEDFYFHRIQFKDAFWEMFTEHFLNYENDGKPIYELIYALQLENTEKIFDKLPGIFTKLTRELAECYVLGYHDKAIDFLIQNNNLSFQKQVAFLETMQQAIKKVERESIKANLPKFYERLTFELSDAEMTNVTTKVGREHLKAKFKEWDKELEHKKEPVIFYSLGNENRMTPKRKVISLSWVKYAVAACLVIVSGVWVFKYSNPDIVPTENGVVTKDSTSVVVPTNEILNEAVAYTTKVSEKVIQYPSDLGFTNTTKSHVVTIYLKDASESIEKLKRELNNEDQGGSAGDRPIFKSLKKQLNLLLSQQGSYEFDGKQLIIYSNNLKLSCSVLSLDDKIYYLKMDSHYYHLYFTKLPLKFKQLKEVELIEQLEKTSFENEE